MWGGNEMHTNFSEKLNGIDDFVNLLRRYDDIKWILN
jgi:hypothetical protein